MDKIKRIVLSEQGRFLLVGVMNTLIGMAAMFIAYNLFHLGYWISSAMDYIVASIFSYFANKYFTFHSNKKSIIEIIRFIINICICYLIAYSIARPTVNTILQEMDLKISALEQISMLAGMCIFVVLNYFGQKLFVFRKGRKGEK